MFKNFGDLRGPIGVLVASSSICFVIAGGVLTYGIEFHDWRLAQIASMTGLLLLAVGVAALTFFLNEAAKHDSSSSDMSLEQSAWQKEKNRSKWLTRLVLVAAFGMAVILVYAIQFGNWTSGRVATTASVGFLAAGAAWLTGALVGFLFGIPHMREGERGAKKPTEAATPSAAETPAVLQPESPYQPSTSLEQISDWLTKIIVGVGLTQLNKIPGKLDGLASYIAAGLGGGDTAKGFALGIVIHFSVCGFLFGYLWARLYLLEAFRAADLLEKVEKISNQMLDLRAKDIIENQLDSTKPKVSEVILKEALRKASPAAKEQILERAKDVRDSASQRQVAADRIIPVFRALIDTDPDQIFHRNHAQLGYALQDLGKWDDSEKALSNAIKIRDRLGSRGWSYYEFKRALARIRQDDNPNPSANEVRDAILADLRRAFPENTEKILKDKDIRAWLTKNSIPPEELQSA
jgi:hypothetical protein